MNPLKTLRAASVMRKLDAPPPPDAPAVDADTLLLDVLRVKQAAAAPVYVRRQEEWVGVIDNAEIYGALLRRQ